MLLSVLILVAIESKHDCLQQAWGGGGGDGGGGEGRVGRGG